MADRFNQLPGGAQNGRIDSSESANMTVIEIEDQQGRSIACYVERVMPVEGTDYALLLPVDTPVEIFAWIDDEEQEDTLVDLEEAEVERIFPTAQAVLAEQNLGLLQTALTLTVTGDIPVADEDDIMTLDLSEDPNGSDDQGSMDSEDFQLLASFFHNEQEYSVYTPLNPLLIFARLQSDGHPVLLEPEEFEHVRPQLEDQLFDEL